MVLRQCVSAPAALANRSLFPSKDWRTALQRSGRGQRGFQSAVCVHGPMLGRIRANATRKKPVSIDSLKNKSPPPVVSLTGVSPHPNVYRDFSDGDDEAEPEGSVIQLKKSPSSKKKSNARPPKKELRFSDSEEEEEEIDAQVSDSDKELEEEDDDQTGEISRKPVLTLPQEKDVEDLMNSSRAILYERFVFKHLGERPTRQLFGSNIHVLANASRVKINSVEFIKSSDGIKDCPMDGFPEVAFVGRSNVGKSSLVNLLMERKSLALVSKKPGKTQLINHFLVNKRWYLVDLPGYGFASAPKTLCVKWNEFTKDYFLKRKTLVMVVQLIDSSIPVQQIDIDCATWLKQHNIPSTLAFTKCDRKKKKRKTGGKHPVDNVVEFLQEMRLVTTQTYPWILTSCVTGQGRDELMMHIEEFRNYWHS
ncbi:GTP-binding protein At2g22870 [Selaginella moellendorffii]|nr:GTP-binding protein At2g22870 [Selaginella moellendorffii]|eukprot:XP_002991476.2 GTP-binding protein At2g22870 [Selaginella moellendorffii]